MIEQFLEIDKTKIYTKRTNDLEKGVIFIHGNSLSSNSFSEQMNNLSVPGFNMISFDLPGHGKSDKAQNPDETYNLFSYIKIVKGIVSRFNLKQIVLVGHSLGGHIAIEASEEIDELIGLAFFGTPPLGIPPAMEQAFLPNPAMGYAFFWELSNDQALELAQAFSENKDVVKLLQKDILATDPLARTSMAASLGQGKMKDEIIILKNKKIPLLAIHGENDELINLEYINELSLPLFNNSVQTIAAASHCPQMENWKEFNSLLERFFAHLYPVIVKR